MYLEQQINTFKKQIEDKFNRKIERLQQVHKKISDILNILAQIILMQHLAT